MTSIRKELDHKLNNLSPEQLDSVRQFVDSLEHQPIQADPDYPLTGDTSPVGFPQGRALTNEDIDRIVESYRQQNKQRPIGLAKGQFTVPDDFNAPLPDEILDLFNNPQ